MAKLKTTTPDVYSHPTCPNCSKEYISVSYYTGVEEHTSTVQINASEAVKKSQYSDIRSHTGGYCRYCDSKNQRSLIKNAVLILTVGVIITVIGILDTAGVLRLINSPTVILLILVGLVVIAVGILGIILMDKASKTEYDKKFTEMRFIQNMGKDRNFESGLTYMPPAFFEKLKPTEK